MLLINIRFFFLPLPQIFATYIEYVKEMKTRRININLSDLKIDHNMLRKLSGKVILA